MARTGYAIDSKCLPQNVHGENSLIAALPSSVYNSRATIKAIQKYDLKQTGAFLSPCGGIFRPWAELKTVLGLSGNEKPDWLKNIEKEMTLQQNDHNCDIRYVKKQYRDMCEDLAPNCFYWKGGGATQKVELVHIQELDELSPTIKYRKYNTNLGCSTSYTVQENVYTMTLDENTHILHGESVLIPVGNQLDYMENDTFPQTATLKTNTPARYLEYVQDRLEEILHERARTRMADEDSEYSCPSGSDQDTTEVRQTTPPLHPYDTASDGSLFSSKGTACSGAAYAVRGMNGNPPLIRKANIPIHKPFYCPDSFIRSDIQLPSSTTAEIVGLRLLLSEQKDYILSSVAPTIHAIDSMATITAVTKDKRNMSIRDKLREPNRANIQAVRLVLEELGYYEGNENSKIILKWIRGHNDDTLHDKVDRAAKRASFRCGGPPPRFDPSDEMPHSLFYRNVPVMGDIRTHVRNIQKLSHYHIWKNMRQQGRNLRLLEHNEAPPIRDLSKAAPKHFTASRNRELLGLQASPARLKKLGKIEMSDCPYCVAGTTCTFEHIQLHCPGPSGALNTTRKEQDDSLRKLVKENVNDTPRLVNPGKGNSFLKMDNLNLFPMADLRNNMTTELHLSALPEAGMYRPSKTKNGALAVTAKGKTEEGADSMVYPDLQYVRRQEFWKLIAWHHLSTKKTPLHMTEYAERAHDVHMAVEACKHESGDPKNCYAIRRDLLDILIDDKHLDEDGCELFSNPLNAHPRIHSRRCIPTRKMKRALKPFCSNGKIGFDGLALDAYINPITGRGRNVYGNPPFDGKDNNGATSAVMTTLALGARAAQTSSGFTGVWILPLSVKNQKKWIAKGYELVFRFPRDTIPFIPHGYWTGDEPYKLPGSGCYKDDFSDVVIIAIDSNKYERKPVFDWRATQKKIARWFINVLPESKITNRRLEATGLPLSVWREILDERDQVMPTSLCPWPVNDTPLRPETLSTYFGGHHDTHYTSDKLKPFKSTILWPKELTLTGHLPKHFDKVLHIVGVSKRKVKPLIKKISRLCRHHVKIRRNIFLNEFTEPSNDEPCLSNIDMTPTVTEENAIFDTREHFTNIVT